MFTGLPLLAAKAVSDTASGGTVGLGLGRLSCCCAPGPPRLST